MTVPPSRQSSWMRISGSFWLAMGGLAALVAILLLALWLTRTRIAVDLGRHWLRDHGVAANLDVRRLSLTQFSGAVRLGDPADPDLTVDRLEAGYALTGPWEGQAFAVRLRTVRLIHPHLKLRVTARGVDLGSLQALIRELRKLPSGGPLPDVGVEGGRIRLITDGGEVHFSVDGDTRGGVLKGLRGRAEPFRIETAAWSAESQGGAVSLARTGGRLRGRLDLGPGRLRIGANQMQVGAVALVGDAPYPDAHGGLNGQIQASLTARSIDATGPTAQAQGGSLQASLSGRLATDAKGARFDGALTATGDTPNLMASGARVGAAAARLAVTRLTVVADQAGVSLGGQGQTRLAAGRIETPSGILSNLVAGIDIHGFQLRVRGGLPTLKATLSGSLAGRGALAERALRQIGKAVPDAGYAAATTRALRDFRIAAPSWRGVIAGRGGSFALVAPARIDTASGAHFTIKGSVQAATPARLVLSGGLQLDLKGGGLPSLSIQASHASFTAGALQADLAARGAVETAQVKGGRFDGAGRLTAASGRVRFDLTACANAAADQLALDPNPVDHLTVRLCRAEGPLLEAERGAWRARGRLMDVAGHMAGLAVALRKADGAFDIIGRGAGPARATLVVSHAEIADIGKTPRFMPVRGEGRIAVTDGQARGAFRVSTATGHPLGEVSLRQEIAGGAGRIDIDAHALTFSEAGLQPADITPLAAVLQSANGAAGFIGWFAWDARHSLASGGALTARDLSFKSPLGAISKVNSRMAFSSLAPLISLPAQSVTVARVQALLPITEIAAVFDLKADGVGLHEAVAAVARGHVRLEPMMAPFTGPSTITGALVLEAISLGDILAASNLADAVQTDAVLSGRIPFEIGPDGLKITGGRLASIGPGRLTISRKALTGGQAAGGAVAGAVSGAGIAKPGLTVADQPNFARDLAYQAMEDLAFDQLDATLTSQAGHRLGILFHLKGRHDPPKHQRAVITWRDLLTGHAMDKPLTLPSDTRIDLTLDMSLNFGDLVQALVAAWHDALQRPGAARRSDPVKAGPS